MSVLTGAVRGPATVLGRRLSRFPWLSSAERRALESLGRAVHTARRGDTVLRAGEPAEPTVLVHAGWAVVARTLTDGRRQVMEFCLAGDLVDPCGLLVRERDFAIEAVTDLSYGLVTFADLTALIAEHPRLALPLLWSEARELSLMRRHLVSIGRMSARERLAALFVELWQRGSSAGLADGQAFELPVSQQLIADATGLSAVHVNRTLTAMERDALLRRLGRRILLTDFAALAAVVPDRLPLTRAEDFSPTV